MVVRQDTACPDPAGWTVAPYSGSEMQGVAWFVAGLVVGATGAWAWWRRGVSDHVIVDPSSVAAPVRRPTEPPPTSSSDEPSAELDNSEVHSEEAVALAAVDPTGSSPRPVPQNQSGEAALGDEVIALRARLTAVQSHAEAGERAHRAERARLTLEIDRLEALVARLQRRQDADPAPDRRTSNRLAQQAEALAEKEVRLRVLAQRVAELERALSPD